MAAPRSAKVPLGATQREIVNAINGLDGRAITEFTPSGAADASRPEIKISMDANYLYLQPSAGVWARIALSW